MEQLQQIFDCAVEAVMQASGLDFDALANLCKTLTPDLIIETGHAFFFEDEDAPCNKIWRYMESFE